MKEIILELVDPDHGKTKVSCFDFKNEGQTLLLAIRFFPEMVARNASGILSLRSLPYVNFLEPIKLCKPLKSLLQIDDDQDDCSMLFEALDDQAYYTSINSPV
jgi:hypothetical protein